MDESREHTRARDINPPSADRAKRPGKHEGLKDETRKVFPYSVHEQAVMTKRPDRNASLPR
jgi:hypothetical protein